MLAMNAFAEEAYQAPVEDILFAMRALAGFADNAQRLGCGSDADALLPERLQTLDEFGRDHIRPLNAVGTDRETAWFDGSITLSYESCTAHRRLLELGWHAWSIPREAGGAGLPMAQQSAYVDILNGHNAGFSLLTLLTNGVAWALLAAPDSPARNRTLAELVAGRWSATMCFTEAEAGSDLTRLSTTAEPMPDGRWRLQGAKSLIGFGAHDVCKNIMHLVAAKLPADAGGQQPIALFLVPRESNAVACTGLEPTLGMRDSPTVSLQFDGALGDRLGNDGDGLRLMTGVLAITRVVVALQAVGIGEAAYQAAVARARKRQQGRDARGQSLSILSHPDVRRLLMTQRALVQATRAVAYAATGLYDQVRTETDAERRRSLQSLYDYLVPVVKGWCTECAIEVANHGVQVFGGRGVIDPAPTRYLRDARVLAIYEGTTAIQARDLLRRKLFADGGATAFTWLAQVAATGDALAAMAEDDEAVLAESLRGAAQALRTCIDHLLSLQTTAQERAMAVSVPFLMANGYVAGGWQLAHSMLALRTPGTASAAFRTAKMLTARFYAEHLLVRVIALRQEILAGGEVVLRMPADAF